MYVTRLHPLATALPVIFASVVRALQLPLEALADHRVRRVRSVWLVPFHLNCVRLVLWRRRRLETLCFRRACRVLLACIAVCMGPHHPPHSARVDMFALVVPIPLCLSAVPVMLVRRVPTVWLVRWHHHYVKLAPTTRTTLDLLALRARPVRCVSLSV